MDERELLQVIQDLLAARLLLEESAGRYAFRHALTRDAVYGTLVRRERKALHEEVGKAMERLHAGHLETQLGDLAYHFYEAGEWEKALVYAMQAGERSQAAFALREAVADYTRALEASQHLAGWPRAVHLYRQRGHAHDTLGEFDLALADHEAALRLARTSHDRRAEWQALVDLGLLWASRDYGQTGAHLQQALGLARSLDDNSILGQTLNRLGNWHANLEKNLEARSYHQEALEVFRLMNDRQGMAETLDLLGMTACLGGDMPTGEVYLQQAIGLFEEIGDRRGLASSLASVAMCGPSYQTDALVPVRKSLDEATRQAEQSLSLAREIGWRSAEAYSLFMLANCLGPRGRYDQALPYAWTGLRIAEDIEHRQWITAHSFTLGALYYDLLNYDEARLHLAVGLSLAKEIGSTFFQRLVAGCLALVCTAVGDFEQAQSLLDWALPDDAPAQSQTQRSAWYARLSLALARGQPALALTIADNLIASAAGVAERGERALPRLLLRRAEALSGLGREAEAENALREALLGAQEIDTPPLAWRVLARLGWLLRSQGRLPEAVEAGGAAWAIVQELSARIPRDGLRETYLTHATALIDSPA
jgi:tetratricopeptide (TPR) repeat protein